MLNEVRSQKACTTGDENLGQCQLPESSLLDAVFAGRHGDCILRGPLGVEVSPNLGGEIIDADRLDEFARYLPDPEGGPERIRKWAEDNPVGGFYGLRKGYRGRFGMYVPPLMEALGLAELTHEKRNNRIRAI